MILEKLLWLLRVWGIREIQKYQFRGCFCLGEKCLGLKDSWCSGGCATLQSHAGERTTGLSWWLDMTREGERGIREKVEFSKSVGCLSEWWCSSPDWDNWRGSKLERKDKSVLDQLNFNKRCLERMEWFWIRKERLLWLVY